MAEPSVQDEKAAGSGAEKAATPADGRPSLDPRQMRRRLIWASIWGFVGINLLMIMRFFFPRTLFEPKSVFTVGTPSDFSLGVDTRFGPVFVPTSSGAGASFGLRTQLVAGYRM